MSIVSETIDYSPLLTWKLPPKKCIDFKNLELIPIDTSSGTLQLFQNCTIQGPHIPNSTNTTCQITTDQQHHIQQHEQQQHEPPLQIHHQQHHIQHPQQMQHQSLQQHQQQQHQQQQQQHQQLQQQQTQCNSEPQMNTVSLETTEKATSKKVKDKVPIKKKFKRFPVDGMAYHSQQLGLKVPPKKTLGIKGMIIHSQAREVINNVFKFMKEEAHNGIKIPIANYRERVLSATGISKCTYSKITTKEFRLGEPQPCRKRKSLKLDDSFLDKTVTENDSLYRPKINRDASTRDGVYNLEDLVPGYILDTLAPEAGQIMTMGTVDPFNLSPFPASSISKILMADASEEIQVRSITIFLYIHYLIKYMITPMKAVTKKFVACDKSADVNSHILDNFSVNSPHGRTRPLHIKDKALCFILVLAAIALNYEVDVQSLSKDLKIGVKKTLEVSRILAFNASSKDKNVVQLKLPLPEPVSFNPKRKRKTL
ncbi:uncharacterized protein isoform X1 [Leptinotarsa decemlineata]|uniref:uncharacterized protein isoform X1 n=1 Tax=Leptinotarsa decemlineata TaxID=7539 RepID=UPI003D306170